MENLYSKVFVRLSGFFKGTYHKIKRPSRTCQGVNMVLENKRKVSKKLILTTYTTILQLFYSMCARSMKMSFPDPSENHQPYTKNSVKIIWIYIFVHFRQPCNAHRAERKEEGSVLPGFQGQLVFTRTVVYIFITVPRRLFIPALQ